MSATTSPSTPIAIRRHAPQPIHARDPVRDHRLVAIASTAVIVALGIVLVATLGPAILPIYLLPLPFALVLLWLSVEAVRCDERLDAPAR